MGDAQRRRILTVGKALLFRGGGSGFEAAGPFKGGYTLPALPGAGARWCVSEEGGAGWPPTRN